ncbi:hypothetical protein ACQEVC_21405 [Plantactinospora sp. CA-294935]|uniref:hypothetical protein n=1 Tax=Plantactinospora sp. CA-294935 TaxID=3240012 RepID=UPI003D91DF42
MAEERSELSLDEAVELTRTGDVWVFRGRSVPDRAIQFTTNSPVNHVGMSVVIEDLPPLMWHAELGRSLPDMWSGNHHRGVQLHDLRDAVRIWGVRYGQRAWLRQLEPPVDDEMENGVLRTIARLDGTPFPSTAQLAWRWLRGRAPAVRRRPSDSTLNLFQPEPRGAHTPRPTSRADGPQGEVEKGSLETAYCAEVVAATYQAMGLLPAGRRPNWYDPGRFWSGDDLELSAGRRLGNEISVRIPAR